MLPLGLIICHSATPFPCMWIQAGTNLGRIIGAPLLLLMEFGYMFKDYDDDPCGGAA